MANSTTNPSHVVGQVPVLASNKSSYDAIPYASYPVAASHPDRLYNIGTLFGLQPRIPDKARILELGCAGGGNLLPIASQFPNAHCVGVELSEVQCNDAKTAVKFLGLKNIEIRHESISDITSSLGTFDYIICHGVFSWVPDPVREDILRVSAQNLAENGIAYISYNTLPGWYQRGMVRAMMMQHVRHIPDAKTKIIQARALLKFLVNSTVGHESAYALYLRTEAEFLENLPDNYLFHEHLEENNKAFFFQDFIQAASKHGLQFLGEATLPTMWIGNLPFEAARTLEALQDSVQRGQYTDCIVGRTFRETLLVSSNATIDRNIDPNRLESIRFLGRFTVDESESSNALPAGKREYTTRTGSKLIAEGASIQAIEALNRAFPCSLRLSELSKVIDDNSKALGNTDRIDARHLATVMMQWALSGYIEFRFLPDRMEKGAHRRPTISAWGRAQARAGNIVTNLRHEAITLSEVERFIVPLLDGTRDMKTIANDVASLIRTGILNVDTENKQAKIDPVQICDAVASQIVDQLANHAMILAGDFRGS